MLFGGIQKNSFIDYPNFISCVAFTKGCNFRCPYCHNKELLLKDCKIIDENQILSFLSKRINFIDAITISGGEPCLQDDLIQFMEKVKQMGLKVKLDTNGSCPDKLSECIKADVVDYIAMDFKTLPEMYESLLRAPKNIANNILKSIEIIMLSSVMYEFRTTCVAPFISDNIILKMGQIIKNSCLWIFQEFKKESVLEPDFFKETSIIYTKETLKKFQTIAQRFVKTSLIR